MSLNIPKLFEGAVAATLRAHCTNGVPRLRTWQAIDSDLSWTPTTDRVFPLFDIRCTPPVTNAEDGVTQMCNVAILIATNANDDQEHKAISSYYEDAQAVLDALYSQFLSDTVGAERTTFNAYMSNSQPDSVSKIAVGGFTHGDPLAPYEDAGAYFIGLNFIIHFSRSDY